MAILLSYSMYILCYLRMGELSRFKRVSKSEEEDETGKEVPCRTAARSAHSFAKNANEMGHPSVTWATRPGYRFVVHGYVAMPEHFHLLMTEPEVGDPSVVMKVLKQRFARRLHRLRKRTPSAQIALWDSAPDPVWQKRFYDFNVWTERKRIEKLRYMHRNPVKRGLVERPEQWRWSSFRSYYYGERGLVRVNVQEWALEIKARPRETFATSTQHPLIRKKRVQSHDILYRVSQDIPYTPLVREAGKGERCLGRRWMCESNG